jgi:glycosyltransferase involved in cell wall biosynthesis
MLGSDNGLLRDIVSNELPSVSSTKIATWLKTTAIVIPVLNEAQSIGMVVDELTNIGFLPNNIYVIDNGSDDGTPARLLGNGVNVFFCFDRGKGSALRYGFYRALMDQNISRVVTIDGDYTYPGKAVELAAKLSEWFRNDVIVMKRKPCRGSMPTSNALANWLINKWASLVNPGVNGNISDICSGLWCFPVAVLKKVLPRLRSRGFTIEVEYYCILNQIGRNIYEFNYEYRVRQGGEKKTKPSDAFKIVWFLWKHRCK